MAKKKRDAKAIVKARANGGKGIVNVLELIFVLATLFVSFNVFFPGTSYRDRWDDAYSLTKARDTVLVMDRIGRLHEFAFDSGLMEGFLANLFPYPDTLFFTTITGGIKPEIRVACNCTSAEIAELESWTNGLRLNERDVAMSYCRSSLLEGEPCFDQSDLALVWGYKQLGARYDALSRHALKGKGIVEVMDFRYGGSGPNPIDDDLVQSELFGLRYEGSEAGSLSHAKIWRTPKNGTDVIFHPYKLFYHLPLTVHTDDPGEALAGCAWSSSLRGTVGYKGDGHLFWICNSTHVMFDTDEDGTGDTLAAELENITLGAGERQNLTLNYVHGPDSIGISFGKPFTFDDFLAYYSPNGFTDVRPADGDEERVFVRSYDGSGHTYPAVVLNTLAEGRMAWAAEFSEGGYGQEEKALLASLMVWAASRETTESDLLEVRSGYEVSYIATANRDMFELYKVNFMVGYPF